MTTSPVAPHKVQIAKDFGLDNVDAAAVACRIANLGFAPACALLQKESGGRNVYGHDAGGALSGYPKEVDESNFDVFLWLLSKGQTSNGVGPCQITYPGFFKDMAAKRLKPWMPTDNMIYGFGLLARYYTETRSWVTAGERYNGAHAYGLDLQAKVTEWHQRFK